MEVWFLKKIQAKAKLHTTRAKSNSILLQQISRKRVTSSINKYKESKINPKSRKSNKSNILKLVT